MRRSVLLLAISFFAPLLTAQTSKLTVLLTQGWHADSLDASANSLSHIERFDIAAVTPDSTTTATMHSILPTAAIAAMAGDPDNDGILSELWKDNSEGSWAHSGVLIKNQDRAKRDRRLIYWSVKDKSNARMPQFHVFTAGGTKTHKVRPGDFVRIGENGNAEFFITQELIMKGAGTQSGQVKPGALCMCQDKGGNLYYSPPEGGHYVSNGTSQVLALEGAIVWIPASAITYDTSGNVQDVKAGGSRLVAERGSNMPSNNPNLVAMVTNSAATDVSGALIATTLTNWITEMTGLAIDPRGGTWTSTLTGSTKHPNFVFAFDNWVYRGTVFSTWPRNSSLGSIAVINGVTMGVSFGPADGKWLGAKGQNKSPTVHGLEIVDWGLDPVAPYGFSVLDTDAAGAVDQANTTTFPLDFQGVEPVRPIILTLGLEPAQGKPLLALDLGALFQDFPTIYTFTGGPFIGTQGISDARGRKFLKIPTIKDNSVKGLGLIWQALFLARSSQKHFISNPIVTEFR